MICAGIDIGGTDIKAALVDASGALLARTRVPTNAEGGPDAVIAQLHRAVGELAAAAGCASPDAIGIGVPGSIDFAARAVLHPPNLPGWTVVPLAERLEALWPARVTLDNDANCAALGEARFGAGRPYTHFIGLTLGTGVGSGIIIDRRIYHGEKGYGGEFGHASIDWNGAPCGCGGRGCIEAYVGGAYLVRRARERFAADPACALHGAARADAPMTPRDISAAAEAGDNAARDFLRDTGALLGAAVASACNLLDITTFIVGGGVAAAGAPLFEGITAGARERVLTVHRDALTVLPAALGNDAGMLGAAALARADAA